MFYPWLLFKTELQSLTFIDLTHPDDLDSRNITKN
jgi:hypothetical protein